MTGTRRKFSEAELARIRMDYRTYVDAGKLSVLAAELGRAHSSLCLKAKELGLTDAHKARQRSAEIAADSRRGKAFWAGRSHPAGMRGKKHSAETKAVLAQKSAAFWSSLTTDERSDLGEKQMTAKFAKHGTRAPNVKRGSWKAGWREVGDKRNYYRSRWEANYARYLEWLKQRGEIQEWQHEPETFWFEAIKRGVRSYLPDFRVWENDGSSSLHEVKGWMDARSKTTLKRMAKYHPSEKITVIREKEYNEIGRKIGPLIEGWEASERVGRY